MCPKHLEEENKGNTVQHSCHDSPLSVKNYFDFVLIVFVNFFFLQAQAKARMEFRCSWCEAVVTRELCPKAGSLTTPKEVSVSAVLSE